MSALLARLGDFSFRRPFAVLVPWLLILLSVIGLAQMTNTQIQTSIKVDGTPAQEVLDNILEAMPEAGGTQGSVVFTTQDGSALTAEDKAVIAEAVEQVESHEYVLDRDARMADQLVELEATVRERAYDQAGQQIDEKLAEMQPALEQMAAQNESFAEISTAIDEILDAEPADKLAKVSALSADITMLQTANPAAAQALQGALGSGLASIGDFNSAEVDTMIATQLDTIKADIAQFQRGVSPAGQLLEVDGSTLSGVTVSDDETIAVYKIQLTEQIDQLPEGTSEDIIDAITAAVEPAGLTASPSSSLMPIEPPVGGQEIVGLLVAALVLFLTLGSLIAAGLPIVTSLIGVGIGVGGAFALSEFYPMTSTTPVLALMLGLAVGIDYALFILHKQRFLILQGFSAREAASRAIGTAGSAVVFAGLTVVIALLGLLTLNITFVTTMALAAAATVAIAVLVSLTALPALLGLFGERIVTAKTRAHAATRTSTKPRLSRRWATAVTGRPWLAVVGVALLLGLLAVPAADMRLGMPTGDTAPVGSPERLNYDLTTQALGEGANGPLLIAVERPAGDPDIERVRSTLADLGDVEGVANAALRGTNEDMTLEIYEVTPETGPMAPETVDLVHALREPGSVTDARDVGVSGLTAINIDLSERLAAAIPVYLVVVVGLSLLVLTLVFRSLVMPVAATAGFLLTVGATFGITTSVFGTNTIGWIAGVDRPGTVLSFLPIMATGILYGLAMDYQIFIGTSIRESHNEGNPPRLAIINGFTHSNRVVVAAAIIMVSVFGAFVFTDDMMVRQFGFTLAVGILIDAFVVRMTFMPAVMAVAGKATWWLPSWLGKILPRIDVEGSGLEQKQEPLADHSGKV